ncbi:hypothetical protein BU24DRAFT_337735 [Aaosphaeria arxii CBS 175.79]|uniref:UBX domain-containing protein 2 n=1 Tax=Aaosphaeria arxii CBS 175.79 TaxID=1450172 RepID=A0A6A5Y8Q1_9PLEO|nr:uncharacterized protein BU24DRAFT_337735 [Aaosphaeria arxii CBS 175.79]KAF2021603.1 hypothetical protein BU24DRAFT_337735 [Aaosphaeria arxii CBS 175.79]
MFYQGTLQSGIGLAIQEQKLVACFVRDDGPESVRWEDDWLQSGWISNLLQQKAVLLRLDAGSTEAGFLSAFCPLSSTPTLVVIHNGTLKEQISVGVTKDLFINKIRSALGAPPVPIPADPATSSALDAPNTRSTVQESPPSPPSPPHPPPAATTSAKGKQRATTSNPEHNVSAAQAAQASARETLRKKKQEEKEELARIQARIEADKVERRAQAEARKAERERSTGNSTIQSKSPIASGRNASQASIVNLNVRLFDGKTIRSTFPRTATLQAEVRPWVDREIKERTESPNEKIPPYFFKQIQAPLPSRELSAGDENDSLGDIDLAPSATLVLIPVRGYSDAYTGTDSGIIGGVAGGVTGLVSSIFGLASSTAGYVGGMIGSVVGSGEQNQGTPQQPSSGRVLGDQSAETSNPSSASAATGIRVRTLADQRDVDTRDSRLYNGNSLDFEPNGDASNRR